jgi:hypothetical protein
VRLLALEAPYGEMLSSLSAVDGHTQFVEWLRSRTLNDLAWRAELKALYEINKPQHPLTRICSHEAGEPEAIFRVVDGEYTGIVECAFVKYLFDTHHEKERCEHICENLFGRVQHHLRSPSDSIVVVVRSFRIPPTPEEAEVVFRTLAQGVPSNTLIQSGFGWFGHFSRTVSTDALSAQIGEHGLALIICKGGFIAGAKNVEVRSKIERLVSQKRRQHRAKYESVFKVFYFLVDCPPPVLARIDTGPLLKRLRPHEILVLCAVGSASGSSRECKVVLSPKQNVPIDFSNPFFDASALSEQNVEGAEQPLARDAPQAARP